MNVIKRINKSSSLGSHKARYNDYIIIHVTPVQKATPVGGTVQIKQLGQLAYSIRFM